MPPCACVMAATAVETGPNTAVVASAVGPAAGPSRRCRRPQSSSGAGGPSCCYGCHGHRHRHQRHSHHRRQRQLRGTRAHDAPPHHTRVPLASLRFALARDVRVARARPSRAQPTRRPPFHAALLAGSGTGPYAASVHRARAARTPGAVAHSLSYDVGPAQARPGQRCLYHGAQPFAEGATE